MRNGSAPLAFGITALVAALGGWLQLSPGVQAEPTEQSEDVPALKAEVARLKTLLPDQSHAMSDVGNHFTNLWFAGQAGNWPLAAFFSSEVRSHLRWAVRIIPKRKDAEGREIDLAAILAALETSTLKDLDQAIKDQDAAKFGAAYKAQMEACMSCHKASNKPYLRLHVPEKADAGILEFRPE